LLQGYSTPLQIVAKRENKIDVKMKIIKGRIKLEAVCFLIMIVQIR